MTKFKYLVFGSAGLLLGLVFFNAALNRRGAPLEPLESSPSGMAADTQVPLDPFAEARKLQDEMAKNMERGGGSQQVVVKEESGSLAVEISDVDATSLHTSVKNGYLTISGESRRQNGSATIQSSFQRMFPLPASVDPAKMETTSEKDKIVLRFPKRVSE